MVSGAWLVTALALLVSRLSNSTIAGLVAGLVVLGSPSLGLWSGFSGPDPLAQALVVTAALAFVNRRSRLGGMFVGLAIAARPEIAALAIAAGVVALRSQSARSQLRRAAPAALVAAALPVAAIQSPVALPDWRLLVLVPVLAVIAVVVALAPERVLKFAAVAGLGLAALVLMTRAAPEKCGERIGPCSSRVRSALSCSFSTRADGRQR